MNEVLFCNVEEGEISSLPPPTIHTHNPIETIYFPYSVAVYRPKESMGSNQIFDSQLIVTPCVLPCPKDISSLKFSISMRTHMYKAATT